jgi:tetratricopeptide (TPR) repeat protein
MRDPTEYIPQTQAPAPGPATDHPNHAPHTLRGPWSSPTEFPAVVRIPGYELLGELGRGGMGVVYKARHEGLNRVVAIKVLIGGAFASTADKARFRLEAESVARLHHPNVVQVYDVGDYAGIAYITFEFVDGPTLRHWQKGRAVQPGHAARLAASIARAVHHAHDAGIIHRDLKPANILLQGVGEGEGASQPVGPKSDPPTPVPKVTDFGLAKPLEGGANLTATGVACGTPNYMAPEQVRGGPGSGMPSVDIWGVGTLLFEMLTGRPLYAGTDAAGIMNDILMSEPPAVTQYAAEVPRDLAVIVAKCLEKEPTRRYLTAGDLADDLERFLAGEPIVARPISPARRAARWVQRNPLLAGFGVALVFGLATVSVVAGALLRAVDREHAARAEEARLRKTADDATLAAEKARDGMRAALARTEEALGKARDVQARAEIDKIRAEENFALARRAVKHVVTVIRAVPAEDAPTHFPLFRELLAGAEPFLAEFLHQKDGDPDIRFEQATVARDLGGIEGDLGRFQQSRDYFLRSAALFRELMADRPEVHSHRRSLGYSLAMAGAVSRELGRPDAETLLRDGLAELQRYAAAHPDDAEGIDQLVRVHLGMSRVEGPDATDEHDLAVLDLLDRQEKRVGSQPRLRQTRAHALNNIASLLTNRGKTDEAEMYWLRVLAIREELSRTLPGDKTTRYELAKCLFNYANQLHATGRAAAALSARERAAKLFDTLRADARVRTAYIAAMTRNDAILADEYGRRGDWAKAVERLDAVIELNGVLLERNPGSVPLRATQADAHTARAGLAASAGRHADAVLDYREAIRLSTKQSHAEFCSARLVCALVRSGERAEAGAQARTLDPEKFSHPLPCVELARAWLVVAKAESEDAALPLKVREQAVAGALARARAAVLVAQKKGMFRDPSEVRWFHDQKDFEPIWDAIPRAPQ